VRNTNTAAHAKPNTFTDTDGHAATNTFTHAKPNSYTPRPGPSIEYLDAAAG
jgi:hypothetical protein